MAPLFVLLGLLPLAFAGHDYGQALTKSILYFEAQRSGYLPSTQRVQWRSNSGLDDGKANGVDLVGGYYDAGDNVKFGLPMAFTITMLSWSVVGDGDSDHYCWQRPEDMTTSRQAYRIDANHPGSDLAGETAAAMAAASIVFSHSNPSYANELLTHAQQLFEFADKYRGKYDSSITVAQKYYQSVSGYFDELLWAAAWLYKATNNQYYLSYLGKNGDAFGGTGWDMTEFSWDVKYAGVQTLVAKLLMGGKAGQYTPVFERYQEKAESFMCSCLGKGSQSVQKTPGGLIFRQSWNNLQFVTSSSFLLAVYSDYLTSAGKNLNCASGSVPASELLSLAKSQVDYILGDNPRATSYMVGYGTNYPQQVHHRGSSIISIKVDSSFVTCRGGYATWYASKSSDPNLLTGAIVGGPDAYDNFADERDNYEQTEPATYNNAPLLGLLARLNGGHSGYNQLLPVAIPVPKSRPTVAPVAKTTPTQGSSSASIAIEQKTTTSWNYKGNTYYRYSTIVTNKSDKSLTDLNLSISNLYGPLWGLTKSGGTYSFPSWLNSLPAGKSLEFVYVSASQADVSVSSYTLV
ncbi:hypothetical protein RHGRI_006000 [Rhododendron griersonianum]|uniref:Endoglucanase n=1 Tax=Rhododendron griersonianum TaxID=479676 RepID=A0AAV6LFD2_9ERIC|nr:hypothetical protein RHGRI_006000 [Rhododendron griersonianum]